MYIDAKTQQIQEIRCSGFDRQTTQKKYKYCYYVRKDGQNIEILQPSLTRYILKKIDDWKNLSKQEQSQIKKEIDFKFNDQNPEKINYFNPNNNFNFSGVNTQ